MTTQEKLIELIAFHGSKEAVAAKLECSVPAIQNYLSGQQPGSGMGRSAIHYLWKLETAMREGRYTEKSDQGAPEPGGR